MAGLLALLTGTTAAGGLSLAEGLNMGQLKTESNDPTKGLKFKRSNPLKMSNATGSTTNATPSAPPNSGGFGTNSGQTTHKFGMSGGGGNNQQQSSQSGAGIVIADSSITKAVDTLRESQLNEPQVLQTISDKTPNTTNPAVTHNNVDLVKLSRASYVQYLNRYNTVFG